MTNCVSHWWAQRVTAIALVPLGLWLVYTIFHIQSLSYKEVIDYLALPWNAALMASLLLVSLYHSALGWQVIVEDYVQSSSWKTYMMIKLQLGLSGLGILGLFFILRIVILGTHS